MHPGGLQLCKKSGTLGRVLIFLLVFLFSSTLFAGTSQPIYEFGVQEDWLTMKDGIRLSVTYYIPKPINPNEKFPVVLEYLPYRKDDLIYARDYPVIAYFARRGYVVAKVDIRGTGASNGKWPWREYSEEELNDGVEIIDQLSRKPFSNGNVGMWGLSWGGFNSIQIAMRQPPALKTIIAAHATDDLYHDDIHYIDGIFHGEEYMVYMENDVYLPQPPDYKVDEEYFENRFNSTPWHFTYFKQQRDGEFWRKNSLRFNQDRIKIPVYLIGGLLDGYRDFVPRMLEYLKVPVKAEMGPWNHSWPDHGTPGPNYEWRQNAIRWWDHWLKGKDTGILNEPRLAVFVRDAHPPDKTLEMTPGHWRYEDWPITRTQWTSFYPSLSKKLDEQSSNSTEFEQLKYDPACGMEAGLWWGELTADMRGSDACSLTFDTERLDKKIEIIGLPKVQLRVSADAPLAHWMAKLEDVHPDGTVSMVAGGALNGSQRNSRLNPEPLEPGKVYDIEFEMHFTTWTFHPGHRIRLAISNALWPMLWPTPSMMTTRLYPGSNSAVILPIIPEAKTKVPNFAKPEPQEQRPDAKDLTYKWPESLVVKEDLHTGIKRITWTGEYSSSLPQGTLKYFQTFSYQTNKMNPADSRFEGEGGNDIQFKNGRRLELRTSLEVKSDEKNFRVKVTRRIFENGKKIRERTWNESFARDFQ